MKLVIVMPIARFTDTFSVSTSTGLMRELFPLFIGGKFIGMGYGTVREMLIDDIEDGIEVLRFEEPIFGRGMIGAIIARDLLEFSDHTSGIMFIGPREGENEVF